MAEEPLPKSKVIKKKPEAKATLEVPATDPDKVIEHIYPSGWKQMKKMRNST